jgi:hypothetical protein
MGLWWNIARIGIVAAIVIAVAELSKRFPRYGALVLSLPLVSILAFLASWLQHRDLPAISKLARETLVLVPLGLPFFLPFAFASRLGLGFCRCGDGSCLRHDSRLAGRQFVEIGDGHPRRPRELDTARLFRPPGAFLALRPRPGRANRRACERGRSAGRAGVRALGARPTLAWAWAWACLHILPSRPRRPWAWHPN